MKPFPLSSLAAFKRSAVDMQKCKEMALGDTCEQLGKCAQPVCSQEIMYDDPKVESLCGMCLLAGEAAEAGGAAKDGGCFALDGLVDMQGSGAVQVAQVAVGDKIAAVTSHGEVAYSRVLFTHEHKAEYETVKLELDGGYVELTSSHLIPVYSEDCGQSFCAAATLIKATQVSQGDRLYVSDGTGSVLRRVSAVTKGQAKVKYVVTEAGNLLVNGVVASVYSTVAGHFETLPFYFLDSLLPGIFEWAPVKASMYTVLESPALAWIEHVFDVFMSIKPPRVAEVPYLAVTPGSASLVV